MKNLHQTVLVLVVFLVVSAPLALAQGTYTQIDYPGASQTFCSGIDTAGDIVGFYTGAVNSNARGFLLSGGTFTTIDHGQSTGLSGINDLGQIVGGSTSGGSTIGFLYSIQTQTFTRIAYPGTLGATSPTAIDNLGTIVGYYFHDHGIQSGFQLNGSAYSQIEPPDAMNVYVTGVSNAGRLVGFALNRRTTLYFNFSYSQGQYQVLVIPNAPLASVNGISLEGNLLVGTYVTSSGATAGFVYQNNVLQTLQFPGSSFTTANGVSSAGEVVGSFNYPTGNRHCFLWTPPARERGDKR